MTLAELLVALMVTSMLLAAVTTLTFALDSANDDAEDVGESQARIRYTTLKASELIKHCKLICAYYNNELVIWMSDDDSDEKIDSPAYISCFDNICADSRSGSYDDCGR